MRLLNPPTAIARTGSVSRQPAARYLSSLIVITAAAWNLAGCDTGLNSEDVRLDPAIDRTGTLNSDGAWLRISPPVVVIAGDTGSLGGDGSGNNLERRAFVSVTHTAIPDDARVDKVVLHLRSKETFGNPFADFGTLYVDHVDIVSSITEDRFNEAALSAGFATIPQPPAPNVPADVEIDVTNQVKADIAAGRPISSFRLRFASAPSVDLQSDELYFYADADDQLLQPYATATIRP